MSDESQITVPPSFVALFIPEGSIKPTETKEVIAQRYELCEDFAQMLVERAQTHQWELGITQDDVLQRIEAGLEDSEVFSAAERGWVMTRLAELLGWGGAAG
jgi:hypothetical protein